MIDGLLVVLAAPAGRDLGTGGGGAAGRVRVRYGRRAEPSAAILASQLVRTTEQGGPCGHDGGMQIAGRKQRLLIDAGGLLPSRQVGPADVADREDSRRPLGRLAGRLARVELARADGGYNEGPFAA